MNRIDDFMDFLATLAEYLFGALFWLMILFLIVSAVVLSIQ